MENPDHNEKIRLRTTSSHQSQKHTNSDNSQPTRYSQSHDKLEIFARHFVKYFENQLNVNRLIYEGEVKKPGKLANLVSGIIAQALGGDFLGGKAAELLSDPGVKSHQKKAAKLFYLFSAYQKDKPSFRRELVEAAFDIFQCFEMQLMRITTDLGPHKALQLAAEDAVIRALDYFRRNENRGIAVGVLRGESKPVTLTGIPNPMKRGFEISYEHRRSKKKWRTAEMYEKPGLVIELVGENTTSYYDKKASGASSDYGYRRLLKSERESWPKLADEYEISKDLTKSTEFTDYEYILCLADSEQKTSDILQGLEPDDESITEESVEHIIKQLFEDIQDLFSHNTGDLETISNHLEHLNISEFRQYFVESLAANRENFSQISNKQANYHDLNMIGHKITQELIQNNLNALSLSLKKRDQIWFDVIAPVKNFTGRDDVLKDLHVAFEGEERQVVISQASVITGLGGIGKSELARKYAYEHHQDYNGNIIWISAEKQGDLSKSFQKLAKSINISIEETTVTDGGAYTTDRDIRSIVDDIYAYFGDARSLFIFDNAEEFMDVKGFLPSSSPAHTKPYILITSRNQAWDVGEEGNIKVLKLGDFTSEEASEFIRKALGIADSSSDEEIAELSAKLQYFPLALRQATTYIREKSAALSMSSLGKFGVSDYLKAYEEEEKKAALLDFKSKNCEKGVDRYIKTISTTWQVTLKNIDLKGPSGKLAIELLYIMAYFSPDEIPIRTYLSKLVPDLEELSPAIALLKQYSMIGAHKGMASIHRLVQEVLRIELKNQNRAKGVLRQALELIEGSDEATHVAFVWSFASRYSRLTRAFSNRATYGESKSRPLHILAMAGDDTAVARLIKHAGQRHIDCKDIYGRTPLYIAVAHRHLKVVELLERNGADINCNSASASSAGATKWTPLHIAAFVGHKKCAEFLLAKGANIDAEDSRQRSPLYIAINGRHREVAQLLDRTGLSSLHIYASLGNRKRVEAILEGKSADELKNLTNPAAEGKRGPLHLAANNGHLEVVELLVRNGADIISLASIGYTPLHMAAAEGHQDTVEFLVKDLKARQPSLDILEIREAISGWTVLHSAAKSGETDILSFLINEFSKGREKSEIAALVNAADTKGTTLLQTAAFHGKLGTVEFLINQKANINAFDIFGATPLFAAAIFNSYNIVEFLLEQENIETLCDPAKVLGALGITPLHAAGVYDNLGMAELLLAKTDVNIGEQESVTPLHVAAVFDSPKVIDYLVSKGAHTDVGINFANICQVLNYTTENLNGDYGRKFIAFLAYSISMLNFGLKIPLVSNFIGAQFTPGMISTALNGNNQLVLRNDRNQPIHSIASRILSLLCSVPWVEKQIKLTNDYVHRKKSGREPPPAGEESVFYDIANIPLAR